MSEAFGHVVAVILFSLAGAPAVAASWASASLRDFSVILHDLDPADGVAPSLTWSASSGSVTELRASDDHEIFFYGGAGSPDLFASVSSAGQDGPASVQASVAGSPRAGTLRFDARGQSNSHDSNIPTNYHAIAELSGGDVSFTLSPRTAARFVAWADVAAGVTPAPGSTITQHADATARMTTVWNGERHHYESASVSFWDQVGRDFVIAAPLSVSFENVSSSPQSGWLELMARVDGEGAGLLASVPEVPEPPSAWLYALGLGGLLLQARRGGRGGGAQAKSR